MKRFFAVLLIGTIAITGCIKNNNTTNNCPEITATAPATEVANLKAYLDANNITATADPRGFFYVIQTAGSAAKPNVCNTVTVGYEGKLTDGNVFDSNSNIAFPLSNLILGWQEGIPLIGTGGRIILYLPPSLAYGNRSQGSIPANSNLIFTIDLKSFY
jgi:FKBP-type peptidyl-prolyl cis-trans isomerase FkpA